MSTVVFKFHTKTTQRGRIRLQSGERKPVPEGATPRITKLMALAIKFEQLVSTRQINDYAELARLGRVTRARMSQIMSLISLAPDIQEEILFLPRTVRGRDAVASRDLIQFAKEVDQEIQRELWSRLKSESSISILDN